MSSVQHHPQSEISTVEASENITKTQGKILEDHSSFTVLKESGNILSETKDIKQDEQGVNRIALSSREELISISETYGLVAQFQSADTIFTEEERYAQKVKKNQHDEIKSTEKKSEQSSSDKQSIKIDHNQQYTQYINLRNDSTSFTQTAPFQFLQESNIQAKSINQHNQNMENLFTQVHTQQIAIQHSTCKSIQNNSQAVQIDKNVQKSNRLINANQGEQNLNRKFQIMKTLEQSHIPKIKSQIFPALPQQIVTSNVRTQIATSSQISKQQLPKKETQSFKLQSLYITQLRTNSVVKPPQSSAQKKPKFWQTFKNKRQSRQAAAAAQATADPLKSTESVNNITQVAQDTSIVETKPLSQSLDFQKKQNATEVQVITQPNKIELALKTQAAIESKPVQSEKTEVKIEQQTLNLTKKQQNKVIHKPLFVDQSKQNDVIQFNHAHHHPLQRINQQLPVSKPETQIQDKQQQPSIPIQNSINGKLQEQQNKVDAPQEQKQQKQMQEQKYNYGIQSQSEASPSQKEQIIIDYTHNKKYQEELQKENKQKIKSLELKLKYQEEINRQLQKSLSLPIKFLTSAAVGLSTAGITWAAKKNKNISILLGVATTLATFVFSY